MGATSFWRDTTHARRALEVEPKVSNLMAHLAADGSSSDQRLMAGPGRFWNHPSRASLEFTSSNRPPRPYSSVSTCCVCEAFLKQRLSGQFAGDNSFSVFRIRPGMRHSDPPSLADVFVILVSRIEIRRPPICVVKIACHSRSGRLVGAAATKRKFPPRAALTYNRRNHYGRPRWPAVRTFEVKLARNAVDSSAAFNLLGPH